MAELAKTSDPGECSRRARDPVTPPAELARLSKSDYIFVREAVASHSKAPLTVLEALLPFALNGVEDFRMAAALLKNPNLSAQLCDRLAKLAPTVIPKLLPRHFFPRNFLESLAANPNATRDALGPLLDPAITPRHVREWIARGSLRKDVLEVLAQDPSKAVSARAKRRLNQSP
jgi:hypothetical protein